MTGKKSFKYMVNSYKEGIESLFCLFPERGRRLVEKLKKRILILDGGMGTLLEAEGLVAADYGGETLDGLNENLNVMKPGVIESIHRAYMDAGADVLTTNTFGAHPVVLKEYGLEDKTRELAMEGARLARKIAEGKREVYVAGSLGPTSVSLTLMGGISFEEMAEGYRQGVRGLIEGGADLILFETVMDSLNLKAGFEGADRAFEDCECCLPVMVSVTLEEGGNLLAGQNIQAFLAAFLHRPLFALGLNCSTGPDLMWEPVGFLGDRSPFPVSCHPNAGLPDEDGRYGMAAEEFAGEMKKMVHRGFLNIAGGCCGTTPEHIRALSEVLRADGGAPRRLFGQSAAGRGKTVFSGMEVVEIDSAGRPFFIGEKTNVLGSRRFKRLITEGRWAEAVDMGREQIAAGAALLDVCLQNPDRDEVSDMKNFVQGAARRLRAPLVVDSTDPVVVEAAAQCIGGKALVNSVNLEDGGKRLKEVASIAKRYGMGVVFGCIDSPENGGMALDRRSKLKTALRGVSILTDECNLAPEDVVVDPLVFPCGTGDVRFAGTGRETIEAIKGLKRELDGCKVVLGISNVSFGLPSESRAVLNSVFLHLCLEAGLDLAIADPSRIISAPEISDDDRRVCLNLLDNAGKDPLGEFVEHFRNSGARRKMKGVEQVSPRKKESVKSPEEGVVSCIVTGGFAGLEKHLDELLKSKSALEVVNTVLLEGMDEVGRLFNKNELIIAEVLRSAEIMNRAVLHLQPHMEGSCAARRGTVVLATVKGDVHDIGKSLVKIVFSNNGYNVIDLGVKVSAQRIKEEVLKRTPDLICLSGLLVRSAHQMAATAETLYKAGIDVPILVGGAALSAEFTKNTIRPAYGGGVVAYARDVMQGLSMAGEIVSSAKTPGWKEGVSLVSAKQERGADAATVESAGRDAEACGEEEIYGEEPGGGVEIIHDVGLPRPVDWKIHMVDEIKFEDLEKVLNYPRLYRRHLGFAKTRGLESERKRTIENLVYPVMERVKEKNLIVPRAAYRFVKAAADENDILLETVAGKDESGGCETGKKRFRLSFPRAEKISENGKRTGRKSEGLCLSDFVRAVGPSGELEDSLAVFVSSCGLGIREQAAMWEAEGKYLESIALQSLALEGAEAMAELVHGLIRRNWLHGESQGLPEKTLDEKITGVRVSPGYSCCPNLEYTKIFAEILEAAFRLGVSVTDEYMLEPEASVSALVFHHPEAMVFSV